MDLRIYIGTDNTPTPRGELAILYDEADIFPDEGVSLKRNIMDEHGLGNASKQFTKEFLLPATNNNNKLLAHYEDKQNSNTRNPNHAIPARIEIADVYIIVGRMELLSVTWKNRIPYTYKVVFYGDASGVGVTIGSSLMSDVDWTRFSFLLTGEQVGRSWDPALYPNVFVPIISWSRWFYWASFISTYPENNINIEEYGILIDELRPGMNLKEMIVCIGDHFGFTFTFDTKISDFLHEAFVIPSRAADEYALTDPALYLINVQTPPGEPLAVVNVDRNLVELTQENKDTFNQWVSSHFFVPYLTGEHAFELSYSGSKAAQKTLWIVDDIGADVAGPVLTGNDTTGTITINATLDKGREYYFTLAISKDDDLDLVLDQTTAPSSSYGSAWDPSLAMPPDMTVRNFVAGFMEAFNLVLVQTDTDVFNFVDMVSLYSGDNVVDLDKYVDEQLLTYEKMPVFNVLDFSHADSDDSFNERFKEIAGRKYAQLIYQTAADFSDGPLEVQSIFTAIPPGYMSRLVQNQPDARTDLRHFYNLQWAGWDQDSEPIDTPFLLMYRNAIHTTPYQYFIQNDLLPDGTPQFAAMTTYGNYSMVQDNDPTALSNSLTFAEENTFSLEVPKGTIINRFWLEWLLQVYKPTTYTLEVQFPINFGVFLKVAATSIVFLMGFYHFVMEWEYNSNTQMLKMKLMRFDRIQYDPVFVVHDDVQVTHNGDTVIWVKRPVDESDPKRLGPILINLGKQI